MMKLDRETLNEIVKLKFTTRKLGGPEIDLVKLVAEPAYANEIFAICEDLPDESIVLLSMVLRNKFGLLTAMSIPDSQPAPEAVKEDQEPPRRYVLGARC